MVFSALSSGDVAVCSARILMIAKEVTGSWYQRQRRYKSMEERNMNPRCILTPALEPVQDIPNFYTDPVRASEGLESRCKVCIMETIVPMLL